MPPPWGQGGRGPVRLEVGCQCNSKGGPPCGAQGPSGEAFQPISTVLAAWSRSSSGQARAETGAAADGMYDRECSCRTGHAA